MKKLLKTRGLVLFALLFVCVASSCSSKKEVTADESFAAGDIGSSAEVAQAADLGASSSGRGR